MEIPPITLMLPPAKLSPNARCHYMAKANLVRQYRGHAHIHALVAMNGANPPRWAKATVKIQWFTKTVTRPDGDNALASLKAVFDGLSDAGIFANDRGNTYPPIEFAKDARHPRVVLTITESK